MLLSGRANPSFGSARGDDPELASYLRIEPTTPIRFGPQIRWLVSRAVIVISPGFLGLMRSTATPRSLDLAVLSTPAPRTMIVKEATSPTPLNGIVNDRSGLPMTVPNRGPDVATNVQVADPAPLESCT